MTTSQLRDEIFSFIIEGELIQRAIKSKLDIELFIFQINAMMGHANNHGVSEVYGTYLKSLMPWIELESKKEIDSLVEDYNKHVKNKNRGK